MNEPVILVIEDDPAVRRGIVDVLEYAGYQTLEAADGHAGMEIALKANYRLLLLDLVMPGPSGFEILDALKRKRPGQAVIILSARGEENDRVRGLVNGADDYVVKPFTPSVLMARLAAVGRRVGARTDTVRWQHIAVDLAAHRAVVRGQWVALTPTELALLETLCREPDRVHTRRELLARVFGTDNEAYARNVDCHVTRLRRKLERAGLTPAPIHAVPGRGYRLGER